MAILRYKFLLWKCMYKGLRAQRSGRSKLSDDSPTAEGLKLGGASRLADARWEA